jgi:D-amino-acid dehydrogenase
MPLHVVVIGAGIVGAAAAWELVKDGHAVTIVEPGVPGGPQAASYGNGAWISPASIVPMSMPGLWRKVPGYLADPDGPLTIRWQALPRLAPWLIRFLMAGATVAKVEATAKALSSLLHDGPDRHMALAAEIGQPEFIRRTGLLYVFPDRAAFAAEGLGWRLRRDNGVAWVELDADELRQREPALDRRYGFGALVAAGAHCIEPGDFVGAIVDATLIRGARQRKAKATGFVIDGGRLKAVTTEDGPIDCDRAVIAAGIHSKALARAAGDRIPMESERGYHGIIADSGITLRTPVMPSDGRMGNTTTRAGLRLSGQVELASVEAEPNWRRVDILLGHARATYPGLGEVDGAKVLRWMGHRPSTPDGRPVIGPASATGDIIHAFGHGHVGLAAGPVSGRLVADLVGDRSPVIDLAPFAAPRF